MRIGTALLLIGLIVCACDRVDDDHYWSPYGTIGEAQREKQDQLITIICDFDTMGIDGKSMDTLYVESLHCWDEEEWQLCDSSLLKAPADGFEVELGDTILLETCRLIFIDKGRPIIFELLKNTPRKFPYMEFGRIIDGTMIACCAHMSVIEINMVNNELEVEFGRTQIKLGI